MSRASVAARMCLLFVCGHASGAGLDTDGVKRLGIGSSLGLRARAREMPTDALLFASGEQLGPVVSREFDVWQGTASLPHRRTGAWPRRG